MYSTKSRAPSASIDTFGHIVPYEPSEYKKVDAAIRSARKGKQMTVPPISGDFGKIVYEPSPYEDKTVRDRTGKTGFGSSKPFGRDDVSNMLDTIRYRDALNRELKHTKKAIEAEVTAIIASETAAASGGSGTLSRSLGSPTRAAAGVGGGSGTLASPDRTLGLSSRIPKIAHQYDRSRHVDEFTPKLAHAEKYERDYGSTLPTSSAIGEGCGDVKILQSPAHAKHFAIAKMSGSVHLVSPMISGTRSP